MAEKDMFKMKAWFDVTVLRCPNCGHYYIDASWYVIEMESDIQCGHCETEFNSKENAMDRVLLEFAIDESGKAQSTKVAERLEIE